MLVSLLFKLDMYLFMHFVSIQLRKTNGLSGLIQNDSH